MNNNTASVVLPPREGQIVVDSVTAGSASSAITIANVNSAGYVSIAIDDGAGTESGCYLISSLTGTPTNPNTTATSGNGRAAWMSAAALRAVVFSPGEQIKVLVPGAGTYYVRQYRSSP